MPTRTTKERGAAPAAGSGPSARAEIRPTRATARPAARPRRNNACIMKKGPFDRWPERKWAELLPAGGKGVVVSRGRLAEGPPDELRHCPHVRGRSHEVFWP